MKTKRKPVPKVRCNACRVTFAKSQLQRHDRSAAHKKNAEKFYEAQDVSRELKRQEREQWTPSSESDDQAISGDWES